MEHQHVKTCGNPMCGKLIYYYQDAFVNKYCDSDCEQEMKIHNRPKRRLKIQGRTNWKWAEQKTQYPHKLYPNTILVLD